MDHTNIMELLRGRRTYRRFSGKEVPEEVKQNIMEAARLANSGANRQSLRYVMVETKDMVGQVNALVKWAAALPPELGTPKPEEIPTMFVAVLQDTEVLGYSDTDAGLAIGNMTLAAWASGVGSCIMGAINRPELKKLMGLEEKYILHTMIAFGYPTHESTVVPLENGEKKYYLDEKRNYFVPKHSVSELFLQRI